MSAIANSNQSENKPKTSRFQSYWRLLHWNKFHWKKFHWNKFHWNKFASLLMAIALGFYLTACSSDSKTATKSSINKNASANITEVSPPAEIQRLSRLLDRYEPQISIVSPKPEEVLNDTQVAVKFDVKNLPIFKDADLGLGPHIHVILDNQEYKALYDVNQTTTFDNLSVGTHTIRAFASRPWHESFKNQGAYVQSTFHVLTKTDENSPEVKTPLLTYSRPVGTYGAEPIMLDFYLQNAPLHLLAKDDDAINDWQVRATVDGQSFTFDRWEPIYLKGFKQGKNWVKLELIEDDGDAIANVFNSSAHLIDFQPNGQDTLARLIRGEKIANIEAIVNPDYVPPTPKVTLAPIESVSPAPTVNLEKKLTETPKTLVPTPKTESKEEIKPTVKAKPLKAIAPKADPTKAVVPQKEPDAIAPNVRKDYLKNYSFSSRKVSPIKSEVIKPLTKLELKANNLETNSKEITLESKPKDSLPELTDLSTTTSKPIKVLNKSER